MRTSQRRPAGVSIGCGPSTAKGSAFRPATTASSRAVAGSGAGCFVLRGGESGTAAFYRILPGAPMPSSTKGVQLKTRHRACKKKLRKTKATVEGFRAQSIPQPPQAMATCVATKFVPSRESNLARVAPCAGPRNTTEGAKIRWFEWSSTVERNINCDENLPEEMCRRAGYHAAGSPRTIALPTLATRLLPR